MRACRTWRCAGESECAPGQWVYGSDRYTAPQRNGSYDPFFSDPNDLPPIYPQVVETRDVVSW